MHFIYKVPGKAIVTKRIDICAGISLDLIHVRFARISIAIEKGCFTIYSEESCVMHACKFVTFSFTGHDRISHTV